MRASRGLLVLLLVLIGAIALERAGWLPERVSLVVQQAEGWLGPLLREAGLDPAPSPEHPPRSWPRPGPSAPPPAGPPSPPTGPSGSAPGPSSQVPDEDTPPTDIPESDDVRAALVLLARLPVAPERPQGYERAAWPHWLDADGDCQDTREEVLLAESLVRARLSPDGCRVVAGRWRDAYTGENVRDPTQLDVDHLVPLAEAYRSGGIDWDTARRAAYANDLGDARTLIAVTASVNRSKGDQGPEDWLPPLASERCRYLADWVAVKARWQLAMDERERVSVGNGLRDCVSG